MSESPAATSSAALFAAISAGDLDQVRQLINDQPELVNARNQDGLGGVMAALYMGQRPIADLLADSGTDLDIFAATSLGKHDLVRQMLQDDPALATARSVDGWTPLHLAAFFGHTPIAATLLEHQAEVNARSQNSMDNLPIHAATPSANYDLLALLLQHGAEVDARQENGWTAMHEAALIGSIPIVTLLLEHGADPTLANDQGQTPLTIAQEKGHSEVIALLQRGAPAA